MLWGNMVRLLFIIFTDLLLMTFAVTATAQDKAKTPQASEPIKTEKATPKQDDSSEKDSLDLDAFFKKGEENAKTSRCDKPAKPADPIA